MLPVDRHAWTNRWRSVAAAEKALFAGGLLAADLLLPAFAIAPPVLVASVSATIVGAGVPARAMLGVLAVPAGFLLAGLPALAVSVDFAATPMLSLSSAAVLAALAVTLRALAAVSCLGFLILTTPVPELLGLARRLGAPEALVELAALIHRLIFVVLERADAGYQAQAARLGYHSFGSSMRSLGLLVGGLFLRSLDRGRRLDLGLAARGYQGSLRVLTTEAVPTMRGLMAAAGAVLAVAAVGLVLALWE